MIPYRIVSPSRRRADAFSPLLHELGVTVCCDQKEADDYEPLGLPLVCHQGLATIGQIRQFILDNTDEPAVVMADDDLVLVRRLVGSRRPVIKDAATVRAVIENSIQVCQDLGISMFGWNRNPNAAYFRAFDPVHLCAPLAGCFGVIGRRYRFAPLNRGEDIDFALEGIQGDRIVFADLRYYFDFGAVGQGAGGLQGVRSDEGRNKDSEYLNRKWGAAIQIGRPMIPGARGKAQSRGSRFAITVPRKQA